MFALAFIAGSMLDIELKILLLVLMCFVTILCAAISDF
jgi:hypothetical protein